MQKKKELVFIYINILFRNSQIVLLDATPACMCCVTFEIRVQYSVRKAI
jgi:hypothetical protein